MNSDQFQLHAEIEDSHWWFVARRRIMRAVVEELLPPGEGSVVVDVGCGTGANIASLSGDYEGIGIDTSADAIALARRRFSRTRFIEGHAPQDLGEWASRASLFLLMDVLEHVPDDAAVLSELVAAAQPGACFLITVPADERLWSEHDETFGHYRRYTDERLKLAWEGLPVETRLLSYYNTRLYPLVRLVRAASRRRGAAKGKVGTDFSRHSRGVDWMLRTIFAGEQRRLVDLLKQRRSRGYGHGVSLIAVLQRIEEPAAVVPDYPTSNLTPCASGSSSP